MEGVEVRRFLIRKLLRKRRCLAREVCWNKEVLRNEVFEKKFLKKEGVWMRCRCLDKEGLKRRRRLRLNRGDF